MEPGINRDAAEQLAVLLRKIFQRIASQVAALGVGEQSALLEEEVLRGWRAIQPVLARLGED